jgi:hypothetical protein
MSGKTMGTTTATDTSNQPATGETQDLIASDKVEGTAVYNLSGERLGTVHNFMVDKRSGHVAYATEDADLRPAPGRLRRRPHPRAAPGRAELHQRRHAGLDGPDIRAPGQ